MFFTILNWIVGIFYLLSFVILLFVPLMTNRKDETYRLRIWTLGNALVVVICIAHSLGLIK